MLVTIMLTSSRSKRSSLSFTIQYSNENKYRIPNKFEGTGLKHFGSDFFPDSTLYLKQVIRPRSRAHFHQCVNHIGEVRMACGASHKR